MASSASAPNFLLKITLVKTSNPVVHRLLCVPADLQFIELHEAIAAAFGWNGSGLDPCTLWVFRDYQGDALTPRYSWGRQAVIYYTNPQAGYGVQPPLTHTTTTLDELLGKSGASQWWIYDYNLSKHHHAIEVVGRQDSAHRKGKISCLGAEGHIERNSWQLTELEGASLVTALGMSSWDLEMMEVSERLRTVQDAYEKRRVNQRSEATESEKRGNVGEGPSGKVNDNVNVKKEPAKTTNKRKAVHVLGSDDDSCDVDG